MAHGPRATWSRLVLKRSTANLAAPAAVHVAGLPVFGAFVFKFSGDSSKGHSFPLSPHLWDADPE